MQKRECVNMLKKCLNKEFSSDIFDNYFEMIDQSMSTRNNKHCIRLSPVTLEVARHGSYFTGGIYYNSLQFDIRKLILSIILRKKFLNFLNNAF